MQQQPWDASVKGLTAVPQVLAMMNDKLDWTQQVGEAFLAQQDDVSNAIQQLRAIFRAHRQHIHGLRVNGGRTRDENCEEERGFHGVYGRETESRN